MLFIIRFWHVERKKSPTMKERCATQIVVRILENSGHWHASTNSISLVGNYESFTTIIAILTYFTSKMGLQSSKSRKRGTFRKNFFDKSCSYNLPLKVLFRWVSLKVKPEITRVEKVGKTAKSWKIMSFEPLPSSKEKSSRKTRQNKMIHIDYRYNSCI